MKKILLISGVLVAAIVTGCGGDKGASSTPVVVGTPSFLNGAKDGGVEAAPEVQNVVDTLGNAARADERATDLLKQGTNLTGHGGSTASGAAASAGATTGGTELAQQVVQPSPSPSAGGNLASQPPGLTLPNANANSGGSSGGVRGTGTSGSAAGMGSLSTAPAAPAGATDAAGGAAAANTGDGAGLYSGGGAGGGRGGGSGMSPFSFGGGDGGGGGAAGAPNLAFNGAAQGVDNGRVPASVDPEDYFKRLTPGDDLFKVVERRYRQQNMNWISEKISEKTTSNRF